MPENNNTNSKPWWQSLTVWSVVGAVIVAVALKQGWVDKDALEWAMIAVGASGVIGMRRATGGGLTAKLIPLLVAGSLLVPPTTARAEEGLGDHAVYVGVTPLGFAVGSDELDGEYLATGSGFYVFPWGVVLEYEGGWADGEEVHYGRVGYAVVDRAPWHLQAFVGTRGIDEATLQGAVAAMYDFAPSRHLRLLVDVDEDGAVAPRVGYFWSRN
jgi:hypothetical protein